MGTNSQPLTGQVAVITGAGRGIGQAIALAYAAAGAAVVCAARTTAEIEATVQTIVAQGGQGVAIPTDVTEPTAVEQLFQQSAAHFGGIDLVVINAGINPDRRSVADSDPAAWRLTLEVNLVGPYTCAKAALPYLKARGAGKIIMIGSGMGHRSSSNSAYACSKAGLWMLTRVLAQEVWQDNISVNELIPGPVETSMTVSPTARQGAAFTTSSEWIKQPVEVAPLALFLATQPTVGPTGQSFSLMRRDP
ncbi:MAG: SDR family oxidoreductase [Caldilineaceae bacterium]|nr:SDR family oxidoreductase [Caldilineaceae bacterium]